MTKLYIKRIDNCTQCPSLGYDQNITRHECMKKLDKFIKWFDGDDYIKIPDWCPLPDCDTIKEEDFKI